jgi:hypothetical protein
MVAEWYPNDPLLQIFSRVNSLTQVHDPEIICVYSGRVNNIIDSGLKSSIFNGYDDLRTSVGRGTHQPDEPLWVFLFHPGLPGGEGVMILRKDTLRFAPGRGEVRRGGSTA